jgi:uncharacterized membrane protein YhhN
MTNPLLSPRLLNGSIVVSALLAIAAAPWALNLSLLAFVFKPLTSVLIILLAWPRGADAPAARRAVRLGLLLSLLGDIALLWPQQGFLPGLIAFLLAHIAYIVAFTREHRFLAQPAALTSYALAASAILALLWPSIPPGLRVPVACYVLALTAMSAQTAVVGLVAQGDDRRRGRLLMLGGALFMTSDALLATNRFAVALPAANLWILGTYWAAQ